MKKLIIVITFAAALFCFSQETEKTSAWMSNSIGMRFSNISGYGISYSKRFLENYTIKANGIVFYDEYIKGHKDSIIQDTKNIIYDFGFEIQRDFYKSDNTRVYMLGGMYFANDQNKEEWDGLTSIDEYRDLIAGGLGVGVEFIFKKKFGINVDFGYKFDHSDGEEEGIPVEENTTMIGLGIGISYLY